MGNEIGSHTRAESDIVNHATRYAERLFIAHGVPGRSPHDKRNWPAACVTE